jgi:AcrR family transcriptional regulator
MPDKSEKIDVKESIITESAKLFLANGFRGTSVKEITEAVGIGRGTLYWYFKSKDEILQSVLQEFERKFVVGMAETVGKCDGNFIAKYRLFTNLLRNLPGTTGYWRWYLTHSSMKLWEATHWPKKKLRQFMKNTGGISKE